MWTAAFFPVVVVMFLWAFQMLAEAFGWPIWRLGVYPRHAEGLLGIITAPLVHGDYGHLFNNSIPILVLGWCLVYFYPRVAWRVLAAIWLLTGIWVWISARADHHIGASGVVYGMAAFLFFSGLIRRNRALMAISLLVVFLYGGMVWGVLPIFPHVSWESHLWGGLSGLAMAVVYRKVPPAYIVVDEQIAAEQHDDTGGPGPAEHAPPDRVDDLPLWYDPQTTSHTGDGDHFRPDRTR
ncbi:MAG: rhomboid family intramembrane serine protease [Flavobacteriales bacterium]|nr:rhomboid family intramembrane serine protease [Flavobacteriales bacterium]MCB9168288.1 rhomboid family intramembrane serine protease [Flavobacteriales bacterium]